MTKLSQRNRLINTRLLPPTGFDSLDEFFSFLDELELIPKCCISPAMVEYWKSDFELNIADKCLSKVDEELRAEFIQHLYRRNHSRRRNLTDITGTLF